MPARLLFLINDLFSSSQFYVGSHNEDLDSMTLNVYRKSYKCGFISINHKNIVHQYSLHKGLMNIKNARLSYEQGRLILKTIAGKKVVSIKCNEEIFDKFSTYLLLKIKQLA